MLIKLRRIKVTVDGVEIEGWLGIRGKFWVLRGSEVSNCGGTDVRRKSWRGRMYNIKFADFGRRDRRQCDINCRGFRSGALAHDVIKLRGGGGTSMTDGSGVHSSGRRGLWRSEGLEWRVEDAAQGVWQLVRRVRSVGSDDRTWVRCGSIRRGLFGRAIKRGFAM